MFLDFLFNEKSNIKINENELNYFCNDMKIRKGCNQKNKNIYRKKL